MNMSVYLSPTAAFATDPDRIICVQRLANILERAPVFVPCVGAAGKSVQYVTFQRFMATAGYFDLQEVQIQRAAGEASPGL